MRKAVLLVLLLSAAAGLAAGCRPAPSHTIVLRFLEAPDTGGGWHEIIRRFEARHPDIHVSLVEGPSSTDTREAMYTAAFLAGGTTYDMAYMDVTWVPAFAAHHWLRPLDRRFPPAARQAFLPGGIAGSMYDGHIYRVPMQSDAGMLYYRKDLIPTPPETFAQLTADARRAEAPPQRWGLVYQGQQYEGLVCTFMEVLWGFGGHMFDANGHVTLDSPAGVRALQWLVHTVGTIAPPSVTTYEEEDARRAFEQGRSVFMRNWPYAWTLLQEPGSPVRGKVGICPLPHAPGVEGAATLGGWGFGIAASTPHPNAAWTFIAFATSATGQKILHFRNGRIPTRRALFHDPAILASSPYYPELYHILLTARPRPQSPRYAQISDALQFHLSAALVGRETPAAALHAAAARIREILHS